MLVDCKSQNMREKRFPSYTFPSVAVIEGLPSSGGNTHRRSTGIPAVNGPISSWPPWVVPVKQSHSVGLQREAGRKKGSGSPDPPRLPCGAVCVVVRTSCFLFTFTVTLFFWFVMTHLPLRRRWKVYTAQRYSGGRCTFTDDNPNKPWCLAFSFLLKI